VRGKAVRGPSRESVRARRRRWRERMTRKTHGERIEAVRGAGAAHAAQRAARQGSGRARAGRRARNPVGRHAGSSSGATMAAWGRIRGRLACGLPQLPPLPPFSTAMFSARRAPPFRGSDPERCGGGRLSDPSQRPAARRGVMARRRRRAGPERRRRRPGPRAGVRRRAGGWQRRSCAGPALRSGTRTCAHPAAPCHWGAGGRGACGEAGCEWEHQSGGSAGSAGCNSYSSVCPRNFCWCTGNAAGKVAALNAAK
jgi:hypothetical protein